MIQLHGEGGPHNGRTSYNCLDKTTLCFRENAQFLECKSYPQLVAATIYMRGLTKSDNQRSNMERAFYVYKPSFIKCTERDVSTALWQIRNER